MAAFPVISPFPAGQAPLPGHYTQTFNYNDGSQTQPFQTAWVTPPAYEELSELTMDIEEDFEMSVVFRMFPRDPYNDGDPVQEFWGDVNIQMAYGTGFDPTDPIFRHLTGTISYSIGGTAVTNSKPYSLTEDIYGRIGCTWRIPFGDGVFTVPPFYEQGIVTLSGVIESPPAEDPNNDYIRGQCYCPVYFGFPVAPNYSTIGSLLDPSAKIGTNNGWDIGFL